MMHYFSIDFSLRQESLTSIFPLGCVLVFFTSYWFMAQSVRIKNWFYARNEFDEAAWRHIFFTKFMGFLLMGIFPIVLCLTRMDGYSLEKFGLSYIPETAYFSLVWIIGLGMLVMPLAFFSAKKEKNWINYPQTRSKIWTRKILVADAVGWFIYLFGYELLFRGILLFPLADTLGLWPAVFINVVIYSATHIPKGLDETLGAIPLGLVLCVLTLMSGTIWIAFWVHVLMAWTNSFTALYFHPDMKVQTKVKSS